MSQVIDVEFKTAESIYDALLREAKALDLVKLGSNAEVLASSPTATSYDVIVFIFHAFRHLIDIHQKCTESQARLLEEIAQLRKESSP